MTRLERDSPCKVNLLLNILGKRADGFHELETLMHPVALYDTLQLEPGSRPGIELTCNLASLPVDSSNLVARAAASFLQAARVTSGVRIHLEKRIPLAAGLGGGSGNAAATLLALNELFDRPLTLSELDRLAGALGSDVPFFLQSMPALALGRGEKVQPLAPFPSLQNAWLLLIHPGFGVSTAWAYQALARFPKAQKGISGRAQRLVECLRDSRLEESATEFYNSLESPVLEKYPVLSLYQDYLRDSGACATLMSGSGSTTFALFNHAQAAREVEVKFKQRFGESSWTSVVSLEVKPNRE